MKGERDAGSSTTLYLGVPERGCMIPLIGDLVFTILFWATVVVVIGSVIFFLYDSVVTLLKGRI